MNPLEMSKRLSELEQKVSQLETENLALLQHRNVELEQQVQVRTAELQAQLRKQQRREQELQLLYTLIQELSQVDDFDAALEVTLRQLCEFADWLFGEVWVPTADRTQLQLSPIHYCNDNSFQVFRLASDRLTVAPHHGLVGRVWMSQQPEWNSDISQLAVQDLTRAEAAQALGIQAMLGVPILAKDRVVAVLVLLATEFREPNVELMQLITSIAMHLGQIIQRKRAEAAIKQSATTHRAILQAIPDLLVRVDQQGHYTHFLSQGKVKFIRPPAGIAKPSIYDILPRKLAEQKMLYIRRALATGEVQVFKHRLEIEGELRCEEIRVTALSEDEVLLMVRDITEQEQMFQDREQAKAVLLESEARFQAFMNHSPAASWITDDNGRMIYVSQTYLQTFQLPVTTASDLIGKTVFEIFPQEIAQEFLGNIHWVAKTHLVLETIEKAPRIDGEIGDFLVYKFPLQGLSGQALVGGIAVDVTERVQAEQSLQQLNQELEARVEQRTAALNASAARLATAQRIARLGSWEFEIASQTITWSEEIFRIFGRDPALGTPTYIELSQAIHPEDRDHHSALVQRAVEQGQPYEVEYRLYRPDGSLRYLLAQSEVILDAAGHPTRLVGTALDITAIKQAEAALRESEGRYAALTEAAPVAIFRLDTMGNCVYVNDRWSEMTGRPVESALGDGWLQALHSEDRERIANQWSDEWQTGLFRNEGRHLRPDGSVNWFYCHMVPEIDVKDNIIGYIGTLTDISDRKQAEQKLQELNTAMQNAVEGIAQLDSNGCYTVVNRAYANICGYQPEELIGRSWQETVYPEDLPEMIAAHQHMLEQGKVEAETRGLRKDGSVFYKQVTMVVAHDEQGNGVGHHCFLKDISDRKSAEAELRQTNEQLMHLNIELAHATRLKDEFLANMSHELRTPLNAILGMSEGLQEEIFGFLNDRQRKAIATVERSGRHLLELINDILDLSKIGSGKLQLEMNEVSIRSLCDTSLSFVRQMAQQQKVQLHAIVAQDIGNLYADDRRLRQVLINLLSNAIKFTPEGGSVVLEVSRQPSPIPAENSEGILASGSWLVFSVTDTGIGIAPQNLHRLFQPFVQIDSSLNRRYNGTGLGLALVRQIAELHGGDISVRSELHRGSCFTLRIPNHFCSVVLSAPPSQAAFPGSELDQTGIPAIPITSCVRPPLILLAEDNPANIDMISSYLESKCYRLILAEDGQAAIELTKTQHPDLILMDIQMPEVDGLEAIRQIRQQQELAHIPIIALTALAMSGDQERCLQVGATEYLPKPVKLKQLASVIQQLLN